MRSRGFWHGRCPAALVAAAVAIAALAGAGCGASEEDRIRATVEDLQEAFGAKRFREACALMTVAAQKHVGHAGHSPPTACVDDLRSFAIGLDEGREGRAPERPTVARVEIVRDDRATATLRLEDGALSEVPIVKQDGEWKVNAMYGDMPAQLQEDKF